MRLAFRHDLLCISTQGGIVYRLAIDEHDELETLDSAGGTIRSLRPEHPCG